MTDIGVERLRTAIVKQAVRDYARPTLSAFPNCEPDKLDEKAEKEIESFFNSEWYRLLCNLDGEEIIKELKVKKYANSRNTR